MSARFGLYPVPCEDYRASRPYNSLNLLLELSQLRSLRGKEPGCSIEAGRGIGKDGGGPA